jgi:hypothetical protein
MIMFIIIELDMRPFICKIQTAKYKQQNTNSKTLTAKSKHLSALFRSLWYLPKQTQTIYHHKRKGALRYTEKREKYSE